MGLSSLALVLAHVELLAACDCIRLWHEESGMVCSVCGGTATIPTPRVAAGAAVLWECQKNSQSKQSSNLSLRAVTYTWAICSWVGKRFSDGKPDLAMKPACRTSTEGIVFFFRRAFASYGGICLLYQRVLQGGLNLDSEKAFHFLCSLLLRIILSLHLLPKLSRNLDI